MREFKGKTAVITGAASGIGKAIAARLLGEGMKVVLSDVEAPALDRTVNEFLAQGADVCGIEADVTHYPAMAALAEKSFARYGAVHVLVNNAGVVVPEAPNLWDVSLNTFAWHMNVHFWGVLHGIKAFMPRLVAQNQEAAVMNVVAHPGALIQSPILPAYSASKAAAASITENLHYQLRKQNSPIRAHILFPGPHTVPSNTYTASRNRPAHLAPEPHEPVPVVKSLEEMQAWCLKTYGFERPTTRAEQVAEDAFQGLVSGDYWILPSKEALDKAVVQHHEELMARRDPVLPFEML
ncbi:MAG: SDR family NAD(P)-dependent oxidoreductase [Proteobacteria bacterium]|nr:SDR family NAD(P)-dependent oxidoreductase [Pseudomonadota bacterium]HQR04381.1 SDR family NAD(P)-dependent oxidoreductase [Rhodocyclaceae bacterium]